MQRQNVAKLQAIISRWLSQPISIQDEIWGSTRSVQVMIPYCQIRRFGRRSMASGERQKILDGETTPWRESGCSKRRLRHQRSSTNQVVRPSY